MLGNGGYRCAKEDMDINTDLYTLWLKPALEHLISNLTAEEIKIT